MAEFVQPSFSSGEIAPAAYGRVDLAKYLTALKTCRNFFTRVHGGVLNRPGTEFIAESFNDANKGRFIPFIFNDTQAYVLDFGNLNMRVIKEGGLVLNSQTLQPFIISSPYTETQLPFISFAQRRDVMTLAMNELQPQDLSRRDHDDWAFSNMFFEQGPFLDLNTDTAKSMYVNAVSGPIVITAEFSNAFKQENVGQLVYLEQLNYSEPWEVGKVVNAGDIRRSEGRYYRAIESGTTGEVRPFGDVVGVTESDGVIRWTFIHSGYGIAQISGFLDSMRVTADVILSMPSILTGQSSFKWAFGAWGGDQGWPAAVTYYQQRKTLASTPARPENLWFSGTNAYTFFGKSTPIDDSDSVAIELVGKRVNAVRHMINSGKLVIFTPGSKWIIPDNDNDPTLTPTNKSAREQGALGASQVLPVEIEDSIVYVVEKGQTVQDLSYQFVNNAYSGKDISVLSKHLLEGHSIVSMAYQHVPWQVIWLVRDDGILVTCTYLRDQEVWGWHRQDTTNGFFEDVCVIPEGAEDRVYFRVRRTVNGTQRRYIERLSSRLYTDIKDACFVDSSLKYDGRNTSSTAMTIVGISGSGGFGTGGFGAGGFGSGSGLSYSFEIRSSAPYFTQANVGNELHFNLSDTRILRLEIEVINSTTSIVAKKTVVNIPLELQNVPTLNWGLAKRTLSNLGHLEGQQVSILADGKVHPQVVVSAGRINMEYASSVVVCGLPIQADFETLSLNNPSQGSILDREKCMFAVRLLVDESRGIFAGSDADHLDEYAQRENENYDEPVNLKTGITSIRVDSTWEPGGHVFVRQSDPLPLSIVGSMPDTDIGGAR